MSILDSIPTRFRKTPPTGTVRVLQTADWHVGARAKMATPDRAAQRREQLLLYVESLPEIAHGCNVDVVLLPGDLFQNEDIANADVERTMSAIRNFAPIPVIIAAGNHDPLDALSQYRKRLLLRNFDTGSQSVFIATAEWQRIEFENFAVTSRSFVSQAVKSESPYSDLPSRGDKPVELLCLHASIGDPIDGQIRTAPVTDSELLSSGYDYAAMGHYHYGREYLNADDKIIAAYSGCLAAMRKSDRSNSGGVLVFDVEPSGVRLDAFYRIRLDSARMITIEVNDETTVNALLDTVKRKFLEAGVTPADFVTIAITGRSLGQRRNVPEFEALAELCFACNWIDESIAEWDWEQLSSGHTTEARFVREMRLRIEKARTNKNTAEVVLLQDALDLALQALQEKEVTRLPPSLSRIPHS